MPNTRPFAPKHIMPSPSMVSPRLANMLKKREYPVNKEPPVAHARLWGKPEVLHYALNYNGYDIIEFQFLSECKPSLRFHSDGDFISSPFIQQFIIAADQQVELQVAFHFPGEIIAMRPRRAGPGEAILGQWGKPLLFGVNGIYSLDWDLFISFYGYDFRWTSPRVEFQDNTFKAEMTTNIGTKPFVFLIRPRYYSEHLGFLQHKPWKRRPKDDVVSGWCSWEAYHSDVTQHDLEQAVSVLSPLKNFGMDLIQLDDGYQNPLVPPATGEPIGNSWLQTNQKMPGGHAKIVGAISGAGFRAGIWTNAALTNKDACEQSGYCLRDRWGELLKGDWVQYVMDCSPKMLGKEIVPYFRDLRKAGYSYFKLDAIRHLLFDGLHEAVRLGLMNSKEASKRQEAYLHAARKGIGEDAYYLSCWGVLSQSIGVCDAMRIATDANPSWRAFSMQLRETARWFFAQRVLFTIDPDHVCVRSEVPWVRMMLSLVTLTGGLYTISDKPELYDEPRMELIKRTLPGLPVRTAETGAVDYSTPACSGSEETDLDQASRDISHIDDPSTPFSSLWCTHFDDGTRSWAVLNRCAVVPLEEITLSIEALALDPERTYCVFDFWKQEVTIVRDGKLRLEQLPLGHNTVLALHDITSRDVVLVGSTRHVSMDAVSVERLVTENGLANMDLCGFDALKCVYTLYAPSLHQSVLNCEGCDVSLTRKGDFLNMCVEFKSEKAHVEIGSLES